MKNLKKEDIKQEVFDLYDDYAHDRIPRRLFMDKLSAYAVGGLTVASLMSFISPDYVKKIQIHKDDPKLRSEYIRYESPNGGGAIKGLLSRPANAKGKLPGIVVVHENRGLNPYIEDVGRRAALAGFISLAPDALTPLGGYPGNDDAGRELQRKRDRNEMLQDFIAAFEHLKSHPECTGKVGVVGFCFGGWCVARALALANESDNNDKSDKNARNGLLFVALAGPKAGIVELAALLQELSLETYPGAEDRGKTFAPACYSREERDTAFLTDQALQYIRRPGHKPWFLHISFLRPHPPYFLI